MKVLLLGAGGLLGRELSRTAPLGVMLTAYDRQALDIRDGAALARAVAKDAPDCIVNAAAYTNVDQAEAEPEQAFAINATAVATLADVAMSAGARLVHFSTDYVFDGASGAPYAPDAPTAPLNVYGASKRAGEIALLERMGDRAALLRTAWLYGRGSSNFVYTMLRLLAERDKLTVVDDQIGTPTWARGLAQAAWAMIAGQRATGILHWTDSGVASWYDFAVAIQEEAMALGLLSGPAALIVPIPSSAFPQRALRPKVGVLDKTSTIGRLGMAPNHWRVSLRAMLKEQLSSGVPKDHGGRPGEGAAQK